MRTQVAVWVQTRSRSHHIETLRGPPAHLEIQWRYPWRIFNCSHMCHVCLANSKAVFVFAQLIKVYYKGREVRPLGKANFQKSRARQSLRAATTKLGSRYHPQNQVSIAPGLSFATVSCSLLSPPLLTACSFLHVTSSWLLQPHGFSIFRVFSSGIQDSKAKSHRNIGKYTK